MDNSYEQQQIDLVAENESLRQINQGLVDAINQNDEDRPVDLVWLTRDELKDYSDIQQAGGINAIKADAIDEYVNLITQDDDKNIALGGFLRLMQKVYNETS